jgi:hypothetical protein
MRAAIYARYSSDLQSAASIDDQVRLCRKRADTEGWHPIETYADQAMSGASALRPGYQKMLMDARDGKFDVLIAEALDRLSRDQEDIAGLYKQLTFAGVKLITVSEGEINELHVGLHCRSCGSPLTSTGKDYLACGRARRTGTCNSTQGVRRHLIEEAVLDCLKNNLMQPELVEAFIREFHMEVNKHTQALAHGISDKKRTLEKLTSRLDGLYDAIADGLRTPGLKVKIEDMEAKVVALKLDLQSVPEPAPIFHPNLAELYRRKVEKLHGALNAPDSRTEAAEILRGIIDRIELRPMGRGKFEIDLAGDIVNMIDLAQSAAKPNKAASNKAAVPDAYKSSVKVVAGVGFEPTTFRL